MVSNEQFLKACNTLLSFLSTDYGLDRVPQKNKDREFRMIYSNQVVAVDLAFERRDFYLFVKLVRPQRGNFPPSPGEIQADSVLDSFDLDDIVSLRSPESLIPPHSGSASLNIAFFDQIISTQAKNLNEFASDVLRGDFSIFAELDRLVKRRACEAAFRKWGQRAVEFGWRQ